MASNLKRWPLTYYLSPGILGFYLGRRVANRIHISTHFYKFVSPRESPGCPEEWPLWTRRTGVSRTFPCPDTKQLAASVGDLGQSHLPRLGELLNSKLAYAFT